MTRRRPLDDAGIFLPLTGDPLIAGVNDPITRRARQRQAPSTFEKGQALAARRACQYATWLAGRDHGLPLDQIIRATFLGDDVVIITHKTGVLNIRVKPRAITQAD